MAKSTQSLQFVCRSCRQSISRSSLQTRAFSYSASRSDSIPEFRPTSSPELDTLLLDWRRRVFTPAALNPTHSALVYKKSRHPIIENDPGVTVTMSDGEDVKLEPLNRFDKPNKMDSLAKLANILGSSNDTEIWMQLPAFLEGMRNAREFIPAWYLEKVTRKANEQGQANVIKHCAATARKTGLSLATRLVTRELFLGSHERFVEARILGESFEREHKFAESLARMLEAKEHCGGNVVESEHRSDMRRDLTVMGVLLEFAATRALTVHGGKDVEGTTGSMFQKLMAVGGKDLLRRDEKDRAEHAVEDWIPIANGMRQALKVNGILVGKGRTAEAEFKNAMKTKLAEIDAAIEQASAKVKETSNGKKRRCLIMLENVQQIS